MTRIANVAGSKREAPVEIVAYDPTWPDAFEAEKRRLSQALWSWLVGEIEHVGSTAVPGLVAKPVIDVMVPVESLEASRPAIDFMVQSGYTYFPYRPDVMHWFCKPSAAHRTHHVHLVPLGSPLWHDRLAFRDALRESTTLATEYARLKEALAAKYKFDREAYTEAKGPFVEKILSRIRGDHGTA
jgi:GrpB-like predicted nucleotidyltransferase (UPF0157 family)